MLTKNKMDKTVNVVAITTTVTRFTSLIVKIKRNVEVQRS